MYRMVGTELLVTLFESLVGLISYMHHHEGSEQDRMFLRLSKRSVQIELSLFPVTHSFFNCKSISALPSLLIWTSLRLNNILHLSCYQSGTNLMDWLMDSIDWLKYLGCVRRFYPWMEKSVDFFFRPDFFRVTKLWMGWMKKNPWIGIGAQNGP